MNAPPLFEMLQGLVATPSMSSVSPQFDVGNRDVIERLAGWLEAAGFDVELMPLTEDSRKANLIATLGRGPGGLVLSGHTDTVPYDEERWEFDPFELTERDSRLYGLGIADMKSFFALAVEAARGLDSADLRAPLIILATADEESTMNGARQLVEAGRPRGRFAVVGEPTGLRPVHAHKGILMEAIHLSGRAGHSSDPALGVNAIEGLQRVLAALASWRDELRREFRDPRFSVPFPTLNFGHVHGGDNPNRICGSCELHIDLRPLPGMALDELRDALWHRLERALDGSGVGLAVHPLFPGAEGMQTSPESELVAAAEELTGETAGAVAFGTEGPFLNRLGMESVILGPGDIAQAHQPNEYLALDRIAPTVALLRRLIGRFCVGERVAS